MTQTHRHASTSSHYLPIGAGSQELANLKTKAVMAT